MSSLAGLKTAEAARLVEWVLDLLWDGPLAAYPCHLAKDPDCPATSGVALVELMIRHSAALARRGIHWELRQVPGWTPGNQLSYVNLVVWHESQEPPRVGWPLAPGKWVRDYRLWLARSRGWSRQYAEWRRRVAARRCG